MQDALDATCVDETGEDGVYTIYDILLVFDIVRSENFGVIIRGDSEDGEEQNSLICRDWPAVG
jgi:hypothetical protein